MNQIRNILKTSYFWTKNGLNHGHAWARMGKQVTKLMNLDYFDVMNISSKFHWNLMTHMWDILKTAYFETKYGQIWAKNMGMPRQEWANMLWSSSVSTLYTKNISWKFHRNLMNLISDILKRVYFGTKYDLIWALIMGMPGQEWANMLSNSSLNSYSKIISWKFHRNLMNQIKDML